MKLRSARGAAAALTLALFAAACGGSDSAESVAEPAASTEFAAGTTMARIAEAGTVKVGTKFDQPLFGLKGLSGDLEGFDVEIAKIIAAQMGVSAENISYVETPSKIREEAIEQGTVDFVAATYTINDKRKERITFAGPYYSAGQDLMVAADNTTITGPETLKGAGKVCSVTGSTPSENIKQYIDPDQLVLFDVYSKCADALRTGQVVAVTTDNVILLGLVDESDGAFKLVDNAFTEEPYGIGIPKGDVAFCEFINETLTEAAASGAYAEAWKKTAGTVTDGVPELPELAPCS